MRIRFRFFYLLKPFQLHPTLSAYLNSPEIGAIFDREFIALERYVIIYIYEINIIKCLGRTGVGNIRFF